MAQNFLAADPALALTPLSAVPAVDSADGATWNVFTGTAGTPQVVTTGQIYFNASVAYRYVGTDGATQTTLGPVGANWATVPAGAVPAATTSSAGVVQIGARLSVAAGVVSADVQSDNNYTTAEKTQVGLIGGLAPKNSPTLTGTVVVDGDNGVLSLPNSSFNNYTIQNELGFFRIKRNSVISFYIGATAVGVTKDLYLSEASTGVILSGPNVNNTLKLTTNDAKQLLLNGVAVNANATTTDPSAVHLTGDETVAGVKTFTQALTVSRPTAGQPGRVGGVVTKSSDTGDTVTVGFETNGNTNTFPRVVFNATTANSLYNNSGFVNQLNGVDQWFFGMGNGGDFGGTPGTNSGRFMGYYDYVASQWRYGFNASGELFLGSNVAAAPVKLSPTGSSYLTGGNVGIGTAAPQHLLHVAAGDTVDTTFALGSSPAYGYPKFTFKVAGVNYLSLGFADGGSATNVPEALAIQRTGNVGIGTVTPQGKLHVAGGDASVIVGQSLFGVTLSPAQLKAINQPFKVYSENASLSLHSRDGDVVLGSGSEGSPAAALTVKNNGKVGLGTSTPSVDVAGLDIEKGGVGNGLGLRSKGDAMLGPGASLFFNDTYSYGGAFIGYHPAFNGTFGIYSGGNVYSFAGGKLGIGIMVPTYALDVAGAIRSTTGGFVFPDGTTQTTAATGGSGSSLFVRSTGTLSLVQYNAADPSAMNNLASGNRAAVLSGNNSTASGESAVVVGGYNVNATGDKSFAGGGDTITASGRRSVVVGGYLNSCAAIEAGTLSGYNNTVTYAAPNGIISGGSSNVVSAVCGVVAGGNANKAASDYNTVGGGTNNDAGGGTSITIAGGYYNRAYAEYATIAGGNQNYIAGGCALSTIPGGYGNQANNSRVTIGGGASNTGSGYGATIGGGASNAGGGDYAFIGGGSNQTANGQFSAAVSGYYNYVTAQYGFIGGGHGNVIQNTGTAATIAGGDSNAAPSPYAFVGGGNNNTADATRAVVVGGGSNQNSGVNGFLGAGSNNHIYSGDSSAIVAGIFNQIGAAGAFVAAGESNKVFGLNGSIVGGKTNTVNGPSCHAIGSNGCTIPASCTNVVLVNCQNFTVPENTLDTTYVNNVAAGTGTAVRSGTAVTFEANAEYYPFTGPGFTFNTAGKAIGATVVIYLSPACGDPTSSLPSTQFQTKSQYKAGENLEYVFKVGANGYIQYTINIL